MRLSIVCPAFLCIKLIKDDRKLVRIVMNLFSDFISVFKLGKIRLNSRSVRNAQPVFNGNSGAPCYFTVGIILKLSDKRAERW